MATTMLHHFILPRFFFVLILTHTLVHASSDADALLAFKSKADPHNRLVQLSAKTSLRCCKWAGVQCTRRGRVARVVIEGLDLGGVFGSDTLTRLDQLRVLSLQNNSLSGPIPDLSALVNLKTLFLDRNDFSGSFPPSIALLHRIRTIDLSGNNLSGPIPVSIVTLDRLYCLRLEWNRFSGPVPPLNQSSLLNFNVSGNELAGAVPVTAAFLRFGPSSFSWNPGLCGEIVNSECLRSPPFFPAAKPPPPGGSVLGQSAQQHGFIGVDSSPAKKRSSAAVVLGFSAVAFVLICSVACLVMVARRRRSERKAPPPILAAEEVAAVLRIDELEEKVKRVQVMQVAKSGSLVFCAGEAHGYTLDQLMRGSAELLGRGTVGTTYKAVLDNRSIVTVKRLDAVKMAGAGKEVFERHMESVGGLRHPNLVPLRAYFQAKEERLLVYDYEPNGSLYSLIHGSKSSKAKPLHWTSCLKIAEDVAQGLSYIHQAWRLAHGNLKSSNVLLGPDFEACIADHCLVALLADPPPDDDPDSSAYRAPEARITPSGHQGTPKSDVYAFGVLLLELLTGRAPSRQPGAAAGPEEVAGWVRSAREEEGEGDERLVMMVEVAAACRAASPEQRPTMWQVLKMIQEIKESVLMEESNEVELDQQTGLP